MPEKTPLKDQMDTIERAMRDHGLTLDELAERLIIEPDTMRKYAKGYQKAGERLMRTIATLAPLVRSEDSGLYLTARSGKPQRDQPENVNFANQEDDLSGLVEVFTEGLSARQLNEKISRVLNSEQITEPVRKRTIGVLSRMLTQKLEDAAPPQKSAN